MVRPTTASAFIYAPFLVAATLFVLLILSRSTGFGPSSNIYAVSAFAAIVVGLMVGVTSLVQAKAIRVRWRLLICLLYFPTAIFSLLVAGF